MNKRHLSRQGKKASPKALAYVVEETGLPKNTFPAHCPYTLDELLDYGFYPASEH